MSTAVKSKITLDEIIPLIDHLIDVEREELRQLLSSKPRINWKNEWEKVETYFQSIFKGFPETEVEADLQKALFEARHAGKN